MAVRRADLHEGSLERDDAVAEEERGLGEEDRDVIRVSLRDRLAHVRPGEEGGGTERLARLLLEEGGLALRVDVDQPDVTQLIGDPVVCQRADKPCGRRRRRVNVNVHLAADALHRLLCGVHPLRRAAGYGREGLVPLALVVRAGARAAERRSQALAKHRAEHR